MKKILLTIAIGLFPLVFVTPAQADSCTTLTTIGSVCIPAVPQLPAVPTVPQVPGLPPVGPAPAPVIPNPVVPPKQIPAPVAPQSAPVRTAPAPGSVVQSVPQNKENTVTPPAVTTTPPVKTENKVTTPKPPEASKPVVKTKYITVAQAVSLSIGSVILGAFLMLLALYVMYRIGKREGESSVNEFMAELMTVTIRSNRKS